MLSSVIRSGARVLNIAKKSPALKVKHVRNMGDLVLNYRKMNTDVPLLQRFCGQALGFVLWYWILFHCYYDYEHLIGHYEYPDPSKWTDAELGIPPDDED